MKRLFIVAAAAVAISPAFAASGKSCEELKTEIAAKLEANHVKNFSLEIVEADKVADKKVVGSCERGSKKIVYSTGK
ncbi:DUF1161 domain-containing protein [Piscinibacter terrae]|uniref:DUF1161 domain-containing protein n=1 Tax=Piscinibacter terrae TaxID=2496871 RepID=UPI0018E098F7|nr:DUF1161 domain-containing protein [Albitalea terrae]